MDERNSRLVTVILSGLAELAGIATIVGGIFLISLTAGIIALGVALVILGSIIDPPNFKKADK